MRRVSKKRQRMNTAIKPFRDALRERVRRCEVCGCNREPHALAIHEIANGPLRSKALDKEYAVLVVCLNPNFQRQEDCHREVQEWSEARQLALLYLRRSASYDLKAYLELTNPRAPNRITQSEVDAEIEYLVETRTLNAMLAP